VSHPTDKFEEATLPDPELNPLRNPILAANMGRWAEVYFTTPPEKRGEAVAELLRELKSAPPPESAPTQAINRVAHDAERERVIEPRQLTGPYSNHSRPACTCDACAHDNPPGQKFCGMCGAPLQSAQQANLPQEAEIAPVPDGKWSIAERSADGDSVQQMSEPGVFSNGPDGSRDEPHQLWPLRQTDLPHFAQESESVPYRYRLYIGAGLAILLAALLYMAWHGMPNLSGDAQSAPSRAIPAAPLPTPAAPPVASAQPPKNLEDVLPSSGPPASAAGSVTQPHSDSPKQLDSRKQQTADVRPTARVVHAASSSSPVADDQSGAEELSTAEQYLHGNRGNRGEAAPWLWKAVSKGNPAATMTLSDMYLRGEGVPRSCDQARLLLVAAARKGNTAAANRLRNLGAFGCE
jgi:hypothetical protein